MTTRMKTYSLKGGAIDTRWPVLDAADHTLGRMASQVASLLMGKHKPDFSKHLDMGDFVVVVNAAKVRITGNKLQDKKYYRHSGYMGGLKTIPLARMMERRPERVIEMAVRGMLPRNRLGRHVYRHLKVYAGPDHPHQAQVNASRKREAAAVATGPPRPTGEQPS